MIQLNFFTSRSMIAGLCVSLALLLFFIAYRYLMARYGKKQKTTETYCDLHRLEKNPVSGEVELYFTLTEPKQVTMELLNEAYQLKEQLATGDYTPGGHIIRVDTTRLANGIYYYQLRTENQKTFRQMIVRNENAH